MAKLQNMRGLQVCDWLTNLPHWGFASCSAGRMARKSALLLQVFISDIRGASNKEAEKTRVDKELGKIRKKFASNNSLTGAEATVTRRALVLV